MQPSVPARDAVKNMENDTTFPSACDTSKFEGKEKVLTTDQSNESVLPVIVIKVNGVKCRALIALIDTGSGSSYISAKLARRSSESETYFDTNKASLNGYMSSKSVRMEIY